MWHSGNWGGEQWTLKEASAWDILGNARKRKSTGIDQYDWHDKRDPPHCLRNPEQLNSLMKRLQTQSSGGEVDERRREKDNLSYWNVCRQDGGFSTAFDSYSITLPPLPPPPRCSAFIILSLPLTVQNCCLWLQPREAPLQLTQLLLLLLHNSALIKETAAAFPELLCTEEPFRGEGTTEKDSFKTSVALFIESHHNSFLWHVDLDFVKILWHHKGQYWITDPSPKFYSTETKRRYEVQDQDLLYQSKIKSFSFFFLIQACFEIKQWHTFQ